MLIEMQEISFRKDILPLKDKLFRLALRITLDRAEAEDVVQDVLLKAWDKRDEWTDLLSVEAYCKVMTKKSGNRPGKGKGVSNGGTDSGNGGDTG